MVSKTPASAMDYIRQIKAFTTFSQLFEFRADSVKVDNAIFRYVLLIFFFFICLKSMPETLITFSPRSHHLVFWPVFCPFHFIILWFSPESFSSLFRTHPSLFRLFWPYISQQSIFVVHLEFFRLKHSPPVRFVLMRLPCVAVVYSFSKPVYTPSFDSVVRPFHCANSSFVFL